MRFILSLMFLFGAYLFALGNLGLYEKFKVKAAHVHNYEFKALDLAKENRQLKAEISKLKFTIQNMESQNNFLTLKLNKESRKIASVPEQNPDDLVNYEVYRWAPEKLVAIADKEFHFKNYEKSAQFYQEYISRFEKHKDLNDKVLFEAGVASYESKKHYDWAITHFDKVIQKYPKSQFYRGAKLWKALAQLNTGKQKEFLETVEEFRKKYRNTEEWKILSAYYEDIMYKYNNEKNNEN